MATVNSAIQSLVDHLHGKMTSNEPLTAEEQTLVANAIDKLSSNTTLEQALVAVATEHLDDATTNMAQTFSSATTALTTAQEAITAAKTDMATHNANLAIIPQLEEQFKGSVNSNFATMPRPVFGITPIETMSSSGNYQRSQAIFAVYDSNGETFAVRPSYTNGNNGYENQKLEYVKIPSNGLNVTVLTNHNVNTSTYYATPTSNIYYFGASAILPLATKSDPSSIEYDTVYSCQGSASTNESEYQGIYVKTSGNVTATKPKLNVNATDQWGLETITNHSQHTIAVLYDNNKHCLVIVDNESSLVVEKYRDGNITTEISIADSDALQEFVNNGDFTVVNFVRHYMSSINCYNKFGAANTNSSHYRDSFGYHGIVDGQSKMGLSDHSAHYRFTSNKQLEPINFFFTSSVSNSRYHGSYGLSTSTADLNVSLLDMNNNVLGTYHYQVKADSFGQAVGYIAGAIMCINPYSNTGILNDSYAYSSTTAHYGIGRTCRAF